ncbi:MAG: hypothetical protein E7269_02360 [Lachnospiraceae bacterium]|nr:hypothetical protein [Lachnospiraceae bacterium]
MKKLIYIICFFALCYFAAKYMYRFGYEYAIVEYSDDEYRGSEYISQQHPVMWDVLFGEDSETKIVAEETTEDESETTVSHIEAGNYAYKKQKEGYYLKSAADLVFLYRGDKETVYMEMGVLVEDFPKAWQSALENGIYFTSLNDVYRVLESINKE